jgi:methionyl-tRNA synthetase
MNKEKKVYLTTSIPYVNAPPHIGYALEAVQTDTLARAYKVNGYLTYFLSGTDENAIKNVESAQQHQLTTQEWVNLNTEKFLQLKKSFNLTFDQFILTSSTKHHLNTQYFWNLCQADIYKKKYQGLYCVGCENFYEAGEFPDNICPLHERKLEPVVEENYFFRLSRYQTQLETLIKNNTLQIVPLKRQKETLQFIQKGLKDFSISRPKERTKGWGIPVPNDPDQIIYVWFGCAN